VVEAATASQSRRAATAGVAGIGAAMEERWLKALAAGCGGSILVTVLRGMADSKEAMVDKCKGVTVDRCPSSIHRRCQVWEVMLKRKRRKRRSVQLRDPPRPHPQAHQRRIGGRRCSSNINRCRACGRACRDRCQECGHSGLNKACQVLQACRLPADPRGGLLRRRQLLVGMEVAEAEAGK